VPEEKELPTSSYVILGLLATCGPRTSYELKKLVDESVGYFWSFPRAQMYLDPERLAERGLLTAKQEATGRRRRIYHLTDEGLAVLRRWVARPETEQVELRDTGLLKLFFGRLMTAENIRALARSQQAMHQQRLDTYHRIVNELAKDPSAAFGLATIRMGIEYEAMAIRYWEGIEREPPEVE
jgi:PadR family transcriptional regulator AphA